MPELTSPAASCWPVKLVAAIAVDLHAAVDLVGHRERHARRDVVRVAEAKIGGGDHIAAAFSHRRRQVAGQHRRIVDRRRP